MTVRITEVPLEVEEPKKKPKGKKPKKPRRPRPTKFEWTGYPEYSGGVGGWEALARPRATPATGWVGSPERTITLPLIVDGIDGGGPGIDTSVDDVCAKVESWGNKLKDTGEPPVLQVAGVPRVGAREEWVLQDVQWGENIIINDVCVQQELTLTLLEYVEATIVKGPAARARQRNKGKSKGKK